MFKNVGPQKVQHSDGYIVQIANRYSVEYVENDRKATVEVDFGTKDVSIQCNSLRGWDLHGQETSMSAGEREAVINKIALGLQAMGSHVELC